MEVDLNHQKCIVPDRCSVQVLLNHVLQKPTQGIAIAINETIISKAIWHSYHLKSGDQITIIKATQGG